MTKRYSIAEARHNLAAIVHDLDEQQAIELTRRGEPVAVLLTIGAYQRLTPSARSFWEAYEAFRAAVESDSLDDLTDPFATVRDRPPGREITL